MQKLLVIALALVVVLAANNADKRYEKDFKYNNVGHIEHNIVESKKSDKIIVPPKNGVTTGEIDAIIETIDKFITLGEKIYSIVEKGKPVTNLNTAKLSVIPEGLTSWMDLEGWRGPSSVTYSITYKNLYGFQVVKLEYQIQTQYGGSLDGHGHFIHEARVVPQTVDVSWGWSCSVDVEITDPVNRGTKSDPNPQIIAHVKYNVGTVLSSSTHTYSYAIDGYGNISEV
eukprot:TRINITY_DN2420_c0_g2_i1.p1 TRINITY_DN2420_c0_g2~~TRINITY_DN2420_c0_g2_i1.p1  ORF type:complete len:237 (+),score=69.52 TRINITY_DN2420_c0_g2_i1:29-712(+)